MRAAVLPVALLVACGSPKPAPQAPPPDGHHGHHGPHGPHGAHGEGPLVHRFEDPEAWAKVFDDPARDAWQRPALIVAAMGIAAGSTVVDLGTGTGYFLPHLSRAVGDAGKVIALDVEPDMIRYVKARAQREHLANIEARAIPLDDPQLPDGSVDRVVIVDTWHHIPARKAYAAKLARALRPGGALYVVDFTLETDKGPPKPHRIAPSLVIEELSAAGLTASLVKVDLPDQYVVRGAR